MTIVTKESQKCELTRKFHIVLEKSLNQNS